MKEWKWNGKVWLVDINKYCCGVVRSDSTVFGKGMLLNGNVMLVVLMGSGVNIYLCCGNFYKNKIIKSMFVTICD